MRGRPFIASEPGVLPFDFDKGLMAAGVKGPVARVYRFPHRAVVAGRGTRLDREVNLDRVIADGIRLYRRPGGGCAVFLDPGNLIISMAFPAPGFGNVQALFKKASERVAKGLACAGISGVYQDGNFDLVMDDRKVGGSCFYRSKGLAYYSASLMVTPDLDGISAYLHHPPREPAYRRNRPHDAFLAGLDRFFPGIDADLLSTRLHCCLTSGETRIAA